MSEKKAKSASAKKKQVFDPYERLGRHTAPLPALGSAPTPQAVFPAEFVDSAVVLSPALPKTEVMVRVQFRCTVDLAPGDAVTLHLPGFRGPSPRTFSLETLPHPDGLDSARSFAAYWAGDAKPKKVKGVVGTPAKQTVVLRCLRTIEESTLVTFAIPLALGLVAPDKLAPNSAKVKLEGSVVRHAEGSRIARQAVLTCTGLKKMPVAEELETYEQVMAGVVEGGALSKEDRAVAEELLLEDVEQLLLAVTTRIPSSTVTTFSVPPRQPCRQRPFPVSMPWAIASRVFHAYEDAGAFVKAVMENAIGFIKRHDHLAVHREVAANWGVKVGAVVVLEDLLAMQYAAMYPTVSRTALLVAHLLMMEPVDVARTFPVSALPAFSLQQELISAFRMQDTLTAVDPTGPACGIPSRCEALLKKWTAVLSVLLTASMPVAADMTAADLSAGAAGDAEDGAGGVGGAEDTGGRPRVRFAAASRIDTNASPTGASTAVLLTAPPPLFTGLREVPAEELQFLRELQAGDWYVFPSLTVAQQHCPVPALSMSATSEGQQSTGQPGAAGGGGEGQLGTAAAARLGGANGTAATAGNFTAAAAERDGEDGQRDGDAAAIPDNAVLFEVRRTVEALELADLSLYPLSRQWLLPFSSSFRVVSVTTHEDFNDLTHVVLDMVGSLTGEVADGESVPEGDRAVARMVVRKLRLEGENSESRLPAIARLAYLTVRRNERRRLHPPTLMRAQYLAHFQEVKRASETKKNLEEGIVQWEVCVSPAQTLDEGVVKPAVWEPLNKKYAPAVEQFFLGRTRTRYILEDNGITVDFSTFTADYAGKGPRPIRRLVEKRITHEPGPEEGVAVYDRTRELIHATAAQLAHLNGKLGLAPNGQPLSATATGSMSAAGATGPAKSGKASEASTKKRTAAAATATAAAV